MSCDNEISDSSCIHIRIPNPKTLTAMTKKKLLDLIAEYPDDAEVVIEVHDTTLYEDLYDFTLDPISWSRPTHEFKFVGIDPQTTEMHELRLCPIKHNEK